MRTLLRLQNWFLRFARPMDADEEMQMLLHSALDVGDCGRYHVVELVVVVYVKDC